ncbi:MAG: hypothetical protein RLZZ455_1145, partial [Candidatus Parcubacteria bacterium]
SKTSFDFSPHTTVIIGPNTAGKSNLMEAITLLANGKSFRAEKKETMIAFEKEMARVKGIVVEGKGQGADRESEKRGEQQLEVMLTTGLVQGIKTPLTRFLVNDVPKRRVDFAGILPAVLFAPSDLEVIIDGPSLRREFLNQVLEQISLEYRQALSQYEKGLRQRNALLEMMRETGKRHIGQLSYWSDLLIRYGQVIAQEREMFLSFVNTEVKDLFQIRIRYDKSEISKSRIEHYSREEIAAASTLVGPHRDDFQVHMQNDQESDIRFFGSRGQQRLAILQLKLMQLAYIEKLRGERPLLLLDDVFSELDAGHIQHVLAILDKQQTIMTTTHKEFLSHAQLRKMAMIELGSHAENGK